MNDLTPNEHFAQIMFLMMNSSSHSQWTLQDVNRLIVPPMLSGQYFLFRDSNGSVIGYASWARLTDIAAHGFISGERKLQPEDWCAGDQLWFIDFIAPFGGVLEIVRGIKAVFPDDRTAFTRRCKNGKFVRCGLYERRLAA